MALGNEVVAKNDPEEESKSVEEQIAEVLGQKADTSEETQVDGTQTETEVEPQEENTNANAEKAVGEAELEENTKTDAIDAVEETEPEENTNVNAVDAVEETEPEENTNVNAVEAEEEEEEDLIPPAEEEEEEDPVDQIREKCEGQESCQKYLEKLEECNNRVGGRSNTAETCHEEMMDWIHSVDHCVASSLFNKVK